MQINWQEVFTSIGTTVGGSLVLVGAATWLTKSLILNRLAREMEQFRTELKAEADAGIERLRNQLQMTALEHQVRFSKLHEKRAEIVAEIYKRLVKVIDVTQAFTYNKGAEENPRQSDEYQAAKNEHLKTFQFIEENRIYLSERVCKLLEGFLTVTRQHVTNLGVWGSYRFPSEEATRKREQVFVNAVEALAEELPAARMVLEDEFRAMLGVSN